MSNQRTICLFIVLLALVALPGLTMAQEDTTIDPTTPMTEVEPNNGLDTAQIIWTDGVTGKLAKASDVDYFYLITSGWDAMDLTVTVTRPAGSPLQSVAEVDSTGVRIAVAARSAYDLWLERNIRQATLMRATGLDAAYDLFVAERLEAMAGLKPRLLDEALSQFLELRAVQGLQQTSLQRDGAAGGEVQGGALGAQAAEVGRMGGIAAHAGDLGAVAFDDHAAANAAVGAGGFGFLHGVEFCVFLGAFLGQVLMYQALVAIVLIVLGPLGR